MPEKVERCVRSLTAKWAKDPKSRPAPRSKDKDGKPQTAESQAWAICTATMKKAGKMEDELTEIMLEGTGMTLMGLAVTNRPHLKGLPPVEIVKKKIGEEEKDFLRIPLLLSGIFSHPQGNLVFNDRIFARIKDNLSGNVVGQDLCVDSRHNPDWGALGWLGPGHPGTGLENEKDILVAYAEPTPIGLEKIQQKAFKYASAELNTNFVNPQIGDKYEAAKLSTDDIKPLCLADMLEQENDILLGEQNRVVCLVERLATYAKKAKKVKAIKKKVTKNKMAKKLWEYRKKKAGG